MSDLQKKVGKKKGNKAKTTMDSDSIKVDLENGSSMNMDVESDEVHSVEDLEVEDTDSNKTGAKRQRRERSIVWQYFTKLPKNENEDSRDDSTCASNASKAVNDTSDDSTYGVRARLKDFDKFQSEVSTNNKKTELQLYLDESRFDRTLPLDVLAFWKANEFRYPILARMARDFLTIPISTVASESTFSASGRVLNEYRSSLSKDTVEALICTKDWLYGDYCSNQVSVDELTEDIMSLDISGESGASNSVNNPNVPAPNASSSVAC